MQYQNCTVLTRFGLPSSIPCVQDGLPIRKAVYCFPFSSRSSASIVHDSFHSGLPRDGRESLVPFCTRNVPVPLTALIPLFHTHAAVGSCTSRRTRSPFVDPNLYFIRWRRDGFGAVRRGPSLLCGPEFSDVFPEFSDVFLEFTRIFRRQELNARNVHIGVTTQ